jgi:nitrogen fixation protein FixH
LSKILTSGKIWPYAIGISIAFIFAACIATIVVSNTLPVEKSDDYMMGYHEADMNANKLINDQIAFDKKYKVEFINNGLDMKNTKLQYRVTDLDSNLIDSAKFKIITTRPNKKEYDQEFTESKYENGIYTFDNIKLPLEGRWNIMAKITIGDNTRFLNIKADTRHKKISEY